jgi:curved DNA-binding protein CbpA
MPQDYYIALGIKREASPQEIKIAYKTMARAHHPDKPGGSEETMKNLNEAYYILRNPYKRKMYDLTGRSDTSDIPTFTGSGEYIYFLEPKEVKEKEIFYLIQHLNRSLTLKGILRGINKMIEIVEDRNDLAPLMVETAIQEKRGGFNSYLFDALLKCDPIPFEQKHVDHLKQYREKAGARSEWDRCNNALQAILKALQKN